MKAFDKEFLGFKVFSGRSNTLHRPFKYSSAGVQILFSGRSILDTPRETDFS
jgi:hypothetical protein